MNWFKNKTVSLEKYEEALDQLQALLNAFGTKTPIWDKTREIVDRERPLIGED
jgi:hypothetical protein